MYIRSYELTWAWCNSFEPMKCRTLIYRWDKYSASLVFPTLIPAQSGRASNVGYTLDEFYQLFFCTFERKLSSISNTRSLDALKSQWDRREIITIHCNPRTASVSADYWISCWQSLSCTALLYIRTHTGRKGVPVCMCGRSTSYAHTRSAHVRELRIHSLNFIFLYNLI